MTIAGRFSPMGGIKDRVFKYTSEVPSDNFALEVPITNGTYVNPIDIDWGDGTVETLTSGAWPSHTYALAGDYQITIKSGTGKIPFCCFNANTTGSGNKTTHPVAGENIKSIDYSFVKWYTGRNPTTAFSNFFDTCQKITGGFPGTLFYHNVEMTGAGAIFQRATNMTGPIPENLFENNVLLSNCNAVFITCMNLSGPIPEKLWANCPNLANTSWGFSTDRNLTGPLPANLFKNNPNLNYIVGTFNGCRGLTGGIPAGFFDHTAEITDFYRVFDTCLGMTGTIPAGLFDNHKNVTRFMSVFNDCQKMTGSIPAGLFKGQSKCTNFQSAFNNNFLLTGPIPADLFEGCVLAENFQSAFRQCRNLTSAPSDLFKDSPNATNFTTTFYGCNAMTFSSDVFGGTNSTRFASVTPDFTSCFQRTSWTGSVAGTAPDLWNYTYSGTPTSTSCFAGAGNNANSLTNYSSIPSGWK